MFTRSIGQVPRDGATRGRRWRLAAAWVSAVIGLGGAGMIGYAVSHQDVAMSPPVVAEAGPRRGDAPPLTTPAAIVPLPAAVPTSIQIPAINVSSPVNLVGLNPDRTMEVPLPGPQYDQAAWYRYSPTPGELGPSVIIGHVDSATNGPSVFYQLGRLAPGQQILVGRADGTTVTFEVESVHSYPKDRFPLQTIYGNTTQPALRLITCGGGFNDSTHQYLGNIVVFAHLVSAAADARR